MRKSSLVGGLAAAVASMFLVLPPPARRQPRRRETYSDLYIVQRTLDGVPMLTRPVPRGERRHGHVCPSRSPSSTGCTQTSLTSTPRSIRSTDVSLTCVPLQGNTVSTSCRRRHCMSAAGRIRAVRGGGGARAVEPRPNKRRGALEEARRGQDRVSRAQRSRLTEPVESPRTGLRSMRHPTTRRSTPLRCLMLQRSKVGPRRSTSSVV